MARDLAQVAMIEALKPLINARRLRLKGPEASPVVLTQRRIFILPTRYGLGLACVLFVMLTGSVNYALSLGFVLTFLLGSMAIVSVLHAFRNLAELRVSLSRADPVFAGETARFPLHLENPSRQRRVSIGLAREAEEQDLADVAPGGAAELELRVPAPHRGVLRPGRFTLFTRFPLGLFYAWSPVELVASCLVYPRPDNAPLPTQSAHAAAGEASIAGRGDDDFSGLKPYHPGDPPRRIAWKAVARGQAFLTKQFSGQAAEEMWLAWDDLPSALSVEPRLSRLTGWVLRADRAGLSYGLRLPGTLFSPASGEQHRLRCLEALARFEARS